MKKQINIVPARSIELLPQRILHF